MALYRNRLSPGGYFLLHLSNRHMALEPVAAGMLQSAGMKGLAQTHIPAPPRPGTRASLWVVGAKMQVYWRHLLAMTAGGGWLQRRPGPGPTITGISSRL